MTRPGYQGYDASALNREERLQALKDSGLLGKDAAQRMDLLCETATQLLNTQIAQVNVLDADFSTAVGKWPPDGVRVIRVEDTGCQMVVLSREPVLIPNTLLHPVMCLTPVVQVQGARSYLGVPIFYNDEVIGSFCVVDVVVREWTTWEVSGLIALARLAGLAVAGEG